MALLKDMLGQCQCVISGAAIEIERIRRRCRVRQATGRRNTAFLCQRRNGRWFLVKGRNSYQNNEHKPLSYAERDLVGEKMVLLPSLYHEELDRERIVKDSALQLEKTLRGCCPVPSFNRTRKMESIRRDRRRTRRAYQM